MASVRESGEDVAPTGAAPAIASIFPTISIAGNIGAGKTTIAVAMARVLGRRYACEPYKKNAYFSDFYTDKKRFALPAQLAFMLHRIEHHQELHSTRQLVLAPITTTVGASASASASAEVEVEVEATTTVVPFVQDRSAFEDVVFANRMAAEGDMSSRDLDLYNRFFDIFASAHGEEIPSAIVFLDATPAVLMSRVRARGRTGENVDLDYLESFVKHYDDFITTMADITCVFVVPWNEMRDTSDEAMDAAAVDLLTRMQIACPSGETCGCPVDL